MFSKLSCLSCFVSLVTLNYFAGAVTPECKLAIFPVSPGGQKYSESAINFSQRSDCSTSNYVGNRKNFSNRSDWILQDLFLSCEGNHLFVDFSATANTKVKIECEAPYPLDLEFLKRNGSLLPYSGMGIGLSKVIRPNAPTLHRITVEFPKVCTIENESLESFNGFLYFFRAHKKQDISRMTYIRLQVRRIGQSTHVYSDGFSLEAESQRAECLSAHLGNHEVYLAGIGGNSVTESDLLLPCLYQKNNCANKVLGTSCVQDRYCKKTDLRIIPNGILFCTDGVTNAIKRYFTGLDIDIHDVERNDPRKVNSAFLIKLYEDDESDTKDIDSEFPSSEEAGDIREEEKFENRPQPPIKIVAGLKHKFECHFVSYILVLPVIWEVESADGTKQQWLDYGASTHSEFRNVEGENESLPYQIRVQSSKFSIDVKSNIKSISCRASYWNSQSTATSSRMVSLVSNPQPPNRG